jgi:hypothetical protein
MSVEAAICECPIRRGEGQCDFEMGLDAAGKKRQCPSRSTLRFPTLGNVKLCDRHAEIAMMSVCGRAVTLTRGQAKG